LSIYFDFNNSVRDALLRHYHEPVRGFVTMPFIIFILFISLWD